jgi:hypothetical protein
MLFRTSQEICTLIEPVMKEVDAGEVIQEICFSKLAGDIMGISLQILWGAPQQEGGGVRGDFGERRCSVVAWGSF